eukprot:TRINITY_DN13551_c0_g1_i1.p1 TRINITY_DN13551_c0_g1~~TRINITY_DN13551_c0_g1_i1.p1  ORF type:complete len:368 (-),score=40.20 TRINITY_DN13551_c0_g1_i1:416-1519(-)
MSIEIINQRVVAKEEDKKNVLVSLTLGQYLKSKPPTHVVFLQTEDKVGTALKLFATHRILSAPVFDNGEQFWGFIDLKDVLKALLQNCDVWELNEETREAALYAAGNTLADTRIGSLSTEGDVRLLSNSYENVHLMDIVTQVFLPQQVHGRPSCHRIAIFQSEDDNETDVIKITNIISQTDILNLLLRHTQDVSGILDTKVSDLGLVDKSVISVPEDMPTINAYAAMIQKQVSCVGIIDHQGCLIGTLSTSNLRGLQPDQFNILSVPVQKFVQAFHQTCGWDRRFNQYSRSSVARNFGVRVQGQGSLNARDYVPVCGVSCRLSDVVGLMSEKRCHRVYLADEQNRPQSIVTLTDVLQILVNYLEKQQ